MAQIVVFKNEDLLSVHTLSTESGTPFDIGRAESCRLQLPDDKASRSHALFFPLPDGRWAIRDLGSSNGTFLNGERVIERALSTGDVIQFGQIRIKYLSEPASGGESADSERDGDDAPFKTVLLDGYDYGSALKTATDARARTALNALIQIAKTVTAFAGRADSGSRDESDRLLIDVAAILKPALAADRATPLRATGNQTVIPITAPGGDAGIAHPLSRSIARAAIRHHAAVATDALADDRFRAAQSVQDQSIAAAVCAPVIIDGIVRALLYFDRIGIAARPFGADDIDLASTAALILAAPLADDLARAALSAENRRLKTTVGATDEIIGQSDAIQAVRLFIRRAAPSDATV